MIINKPLSTFTEFYLTLKSRINIRLSLDPDAIVLFSQLIAPTRALCPLKTLIFLIFSVSQI